MVGMYGVALYINKISCVERQKYREENRLPNTQRKSDCRFEQYCLRKQHL